MYCVMGSGVVQPWARDNSRQKNEIPFTDVAENAKGENAEHETEALHRRT